MLFKALNPEMLSKVVIFFLQSFSKNCMASLPLFAYIYERENKNRPYYSNVPYLCFYNVLYETDKIINVKIHVSHMKYGFVDFCLCLFPFN